MRDLIAKPTQERNPYPWNDKSGIWIIHSFLLYCQSHIIDTQIKIYFPYLYKFSIRYELVKPNSTDIALTEFGAEFLAIDKGNELSTIAGLRKVLESRRLGCGGWIVNDDSIANCQNFTFEASGKKDASYLYTKFLHSMGIVKAEETWSDNGDNIYFCEYTRIGQQLINGINEERINLRRSVSLSLDQSDNSVHVEHSIVKEVQSGKQNTRSK